MNKFFLFGTIACAALTFASCSNSELSASEENAPKAIGFDVYQGRMPVTRAATDGTSIQTSGFGVLASRTSGDWTSSATPNFLYNQKVTYSNSNWTYTPTKYWPTNTDKISFWAYAPYDDSNITFSGVSEQGAPTATVTLPNDADLDFVADCAMNKTYQTSSGNVEFSLNHVMTRAAFKIVGQNLPENTKLKITSIKLSGTKLYSSATYTFPTSDSNTGGSWGSQLSTNNTITLTQDISEGTNSNYLYLIPVESLGDRDISVEVSYTVTLPGDAPVSKTPTVYIPAGGLKQGKSYLYTFTYDIREDSGSDFHPISFSATVTSWDSDTTENLVQK